jgi:hypothetical protein
MGAVRVSGIRHLWQRYIWIAITISISLFKAPRFEDYWKVSTDGHFVPSFPWIQFMTFDRFFLLKRRLRIDDPDTVHHGIPRPYNRVNEWANHIMKAAIAAVEVGSDIGVDEGMIKFEGRSKQKVTIPSKPTPTGIKVWIIAIQGYILYWIWHTPGSKYGPVGVERPQQKPSKKQPSDKVKRPILKRE